MKRSIQSSLDEIVAGKKQLILTIDDENGATVGVMRPLTTEHFNHPGVIQKLTDWRNQNMGNFLTHFLATPDRTRHWMRNVLFKTPGQMLFLVYTNDQMVGHFGFKDLRGDEVLLDNAMRGERTGQPKLFAWAGKTLVRWLFEETEVKQVYGYVMSDNAAAIMMNKQIGFVFTSRHPLIKKVNNDEVNWELGAEGTASPNERYCYKLVIERKGAMS